MPQRWLLHRSSLAGVGDCLAARRATGTPGSRPAGNGTLYIGGYPNVIWIIDEATEKVSGTIQIKSGIPRRLTLSRDRTRFYIIDATSGAHRDRRHRLTNDDRLVHVERGQQDGPDQLARARSAAPLPDYPDEELRPSCAIASRSDPSRSSSTISRSTRSSARFRGPTARSATTAT